VRTDPDGRQTILFVHSGGEIGGAPVSMLQLAASLPEDRYRSLAVFSEAGPILDFAGATGVRVVPLRSAFFYSAHVPLRLRMLVRFVVHFWSSVRVFRALLDDVRPDVVHLNTSVLIPCAVAARQRGVPVVWHVREVPGPSRWLRRWHTGVIRRLADRIIATSHFVAQALGEGEGVEVIHNAVDLAGFAIDAGAARRRVRTALGMPEEAPVVGMIGSVQETKGHALLLQAAPAVAAALPEVRFLIVAGGGSPQYARSARGRVKRLLGLPLDNLEWLRRQVARYGLERHFVFAGSRADIPQVMAAIDVLAFLPQAPEGFGRPLIEAMAMGRPVVTCDVGPSREIMGEGTGVLVPPADPRALAAALLELLSDPGRRAALGRCGHQRVTGHFTLDRHLRAIEAVYRHVLHGVADARQWRGLVRA
jgi:glycosyltransferase involved in cell wall biosynthesis